MQDFPAVVDTSSGALNDLLIGDLKGLGEQLAFVYDTGLNVIGVQSHNLLRASSLKNFMSDITNKAIDFQIILRQDALNRFDKISRPTKIDVKIAHPHDLQDQPMPAIGNAIRELSDVGGVSTEVIISVGHEYRYRSLSIGAVRRLVEYFSLNDDVFARFRVNGYIQHSTGDQKLEKIDFVREALREQESVDYAISGRRKDIISCQKAIKRALERNRDYLQRYV